LQDGCGTWRATAIDMETFGREPLESESPALDAFVAEATI
jgi:hypothetical protein